MSAYEFHFLVSERTVSLNKINKTKPEGSPSVAILFFFAEIENTKPKGIPRGAPLYIYSKKLEKTKPDG